jgi:hypothetical protein
MAPGRGGGAGKISLSLPLENGLGEAAAEVVALPLVFFEFVPGCARVFSFAIAFFDWEGATGNAEVVVVGDAFEVDD